MSPIVRVLTRIISAASDNVRIRSFGIIFLYPDLNGMERSVT